MDEQSFLAVGGFDVGFGHPGLKVEDGITEQWLAGLFDELEVFNIYASSLNALRILSISASFCRPLAK